ncbi:rhodanese-related sulfurtransferase [Actinobacillus pleuropneumoniae]|nr:rhodanese-related sulfurtransferase [Actinobacillus pleuropneumoniae]
MDLTFTQQLQQFIAAHPILIFAWVALVVAVLFNFYKGITSKYKIVENAQATQLVNKEEGIFLDLRRKMNSVRGISLKVIIFCRVKSKPIMFIRSRNTKIARLS